MIVRNVGRPNKKQPLISPETILNGAIVFLENYGFSALSMRSLAKELGINPMTIYYYFKNKECLIKALANQIYATILPISSGTLSNQIKHLLLEYHQCIVRYPELTLSIFNHPDTCPEEAQRITNTLIELTSQLECASKQATLWVHILIDFTHGAAIAESIQKVKHNEIEARNYYLQSLTLLLSSIGFVT
ncbi:TetR/AcrR family transcriptional regulator [Acinetobacter rudis]|uniref:TetR/AcrR family transcriptional regulator n=1 Tax=Acinetobacter rudis TaxID=632955 RepID=UPI00280C4F0C|nr:TetR/AcrR family transcriptional regulator [Acinetobacter rudis]MDQ8952426.1 TetR/AcrR family transcriptional regulator [Acinetobacter rudis]